MELGYHVTLVKDATAAFEPEGMHAAHEVNGPRFAHAILTYLGPGQGTTSGITDLVTWSEVKANPLQQSHVAQECLARPLLRDEDSRVDVELSKFCG